MTGMNIRKLLNDKQFLLTNKEDAEKAKNVLEGLGHTVTLEQVNWKSDTKNKTLFVDYVLTIA